MNRGIWTILVPILGLFLMSGPAFSLDSEDIVKLRKAGISGETIQTIMDQKVIEACAFTVDGILDMKKSGLSDEAIRRIIEKGSFMKDSDPVVYGDGTKSIKSLSPQDVVELKKAGVSDEVIDSIVSGSLNNDDEEHRRAWRMLDNMGLIVDGRGGMPRR
ncbi:MAG: hypothetical protein J7M20_01115 [Deltaproteobacteria bacterium]|nr:hypothetical protein [Deltaproteobacteria bacterium]